MRHRRKADISGERFPGRIISAALAAGHHRTAEPSVAQTTEAPLQVLNDQTQTQSDWGLTDRQTANKDRQGLECQILKPLLRRLGTSSLSPVDYNLPLGSSYRL